MFFWSSIRIGIAPSLISWFAIKMRHATGRDAKWVMHSDVDLNLTLHWRIHLTHNAFIYVRILRAQKGSQVPMCVATIRRNCVSGSNWIVQANFIWIFPRKFGQLQFAVLEKIHETLGQKCYSYFRQHKFHSKEKQSAWQTCIMKSTNQQTVKQTDRQSNKRNWIDLFSKVEQKQWHTIHNSAVTL